MDNTANITVASQSVTGSLYASIKSECDAAGIPLSILCREAGIDRSIIERWKKKDPKTIQIVNSLRDAMERLKSKHNE